MSHSAPTMSSVPADLDITVRLRLWMMMFLQYFAWGVWFVTMGSYIGANEGDGKLFAVGFIGAAYGTTAIAGMLAPFFVGMIADRFFSTERILCVLHLVGAGALYALTQAGSQSQFYGILIGFFLCFMPTLALTNSLSFHHLPDPARQFPGIRVWGTIGWIVGGMLTGYLVMQDDQLVGLRIVFGDSTTDIGVFAGEVSGIEKTTWPMKIAVVAQVVLGLFCLALPHTPPSKREGRVTISDVLGLEALKLLKRWPFAVFVIGSFLVTIPLQFYYSYTNFFLNDIGVANAAAKQTYGQISEIFFMILMPVFFARLGVKYMLLFGMLAWAVRYVLFAFGDPGAGMWMLYIGIVLHGICYDFFFVTGQIYVDNEADNKIRGAAQGFLTFATLGVGSFIGNTLAGLVQKLTAVPKEALEALPKGSPALDWQTFWLYPAIGAAVIMVLFAVTFFDHPQQAKGSSARG